MSNPPLIPEFSGVNERDYVTSLLENISDAAFFASSLAWEFMAQMVYYFDLLIYFN
jgi:hypothetical protein